jgi:acetyl esterase
MSGSPGLYRDFTWRIADATRARVTILDHRLAPEHPFPAAFEDASAAYRWVVDNAARWGGDLSRLILAGESAGANLITSLAVAACYPRPEPAAHAVMHTGVRPIAAMPCCGILEVSNPERFFARNKKLPFFVRDQLIAVGELYLPPGLVGSIALANPLTILERERERPEYPLPPFYAAVGTRDPVLDDTRRLEAALQKLSVPVTASIFPGEAHAFHALIWRAAARACWREMFEFLRPLV